MDARESAGVPRAAILQGFGQGGDSPELERQIRPLKRSRMHTLELRKLQRDLVDAKQKLGQQATGHARCWLNGILGVLAVASLHLLTNQGKSRQLYISRDETCVNYVLQGRNVEILSSFG